MFLAVRWAGLSNALNHLLFFLEALSLQREFMVALLGGPTEATGLKALMVKKYADDPEYDAMLSCLV